MIRKLQISEMAFNVLNVFVSIMYLQSINMRIDKTYHKFLFLHVF